MPPVTVVESVDRCCRTGGSAGCASAGSALGCAVCPSRPHGAAAGATSTHTLASLVPRAAKEVLVQLGQPKLMRWRHPCCGCHQYSYVRRYRTKGNSRHEARPGRTWRARMLWAAP